MNYLGQSNIYKRFPTETVSQKASTNTKCKKEKLFYVNFKDKYNSRTLLNNTPEKAER